MRSVNDLLSEYGTSHQDPTNKRLHWICVPPIVLSVLGLLWSTPVPAAFAGVSPCLNWATLGAAAALIYYLLLSPALAAGALAGFVVLLGVTHELAGKYGVSAERIRQIEASALGKLRGLMAA